MSGRLEEVKMTVVNSDNLSVCFEMTEISSANSCLSSWNTLWESRPHYVTLAQRSSFHCEVKRLFLLYLSALTAEERLFYSHYIHECTPTHAKKTAVHKPHTLTKLTPMTHHKSCYHPKSLTFLYKGIHSFFSCMN